MDLLRQITEQPMDPDYAIQARLRRGESEARLHRGADQARLRREEAEARPAAPVRRRRWAMALVVALAGALFAVAAVQTTARAPLLATEREELIARIRTAETAQDTQRAELARLDADVTALRAAAASGDDTAEARLATIDQLGLGVGTVPATGPGVVVTVDDAPGADRNTRDRVLDLDLQILVNGLWEAGAEAVAVNGHRLSALTAIRGAGEAITVDYRSLTRPYRIEAIGDPRTLPASFAQTAAGMWWDDLARNRGMTYTIDGADELTLDSDPGMVLRYARELR